MTKREAALGPNCTRLLGISSAPLHDPAAVPAWPRGGLRAELHTLLLARNGFVAGESALHLLPLASQVGAARSLEWWNGPLAWQPAYDGAADGLLCFAEDLFGVQFAIAGDEIVSFDPETGETEHLAESVEEWAALILDDFDAMTGFPLAHEWQRTHGALAEGARLVPKTPFVLGGEFVVPNLQQVDALEGMLIRADLARQIRGLPDGTSVKLEWRHNGAASSTRLEAPLGPQPPPADPTLRP